MNDGGHRVSRRLVLAGLVAGAADGALAAEPLARSLRPSPRPAGYRKAGVPDAEALIARAGLSGKVAFSVADARTGKVLEVRNPLLAMPPASTAKTITTLYALDALGTGFRFHTRLLATGPVTAGRLAGDLVLAGSGDPVLNTDILGDLAAQLKAAGVREVTGRFRYYDGALPSLGTIDPGQPPHVGYNPAISGLNLNFNRVHFEWKRAPAGWDVTMDARAERYRPRVSVARMRVVDRRTPVYTYADGGDVDDWTVASAALGKGGSRWLPVRHPGAYAAEVFQTLARSHGIVLPRGNEAGVLPEGQVVAEHASPGLSVILRDMLKYSNNMTAEVVGMTATRARGNAPRSLRGSAGRMADWLSGGMGARKAMFVDHSGLGPASRISAAEMVRTLVRVGPEGPLKPLLKDVAMRGPDGTPDSSSPVRVRAKTGTLNFVSALAGYATAEDGTELAFAIFMADEARRAALADAGIERPEGGRAWIARARRLQLDLIDRWATLYGT